MYENVQREKEGLVGKMAAVETEGKSVREELTTSQESCAGAAKVRSIANGRYTHTHSLLCIRRVRGCRLW